MREKKGIFSKWFGDSQLATEEQECILFTILSDTIKQKLVPDEVNN